MTEDKKIYDTVIIGSGPAGLTAAIYNIRADLKTVVLAGKQPGGQLTITTTVDNYPGFPNGTGGVKLMMDTMQQVRNLGAEIKNDSVSEISKSQITISKQFPNNKEQTINIFKVSLESGEMLESKAVIVATGAAAKWLGLPREQELIGHGISGCATCDGMFFRDKVVAVVGGGDVACEDAEFLTKFAKKVYLIHRRDSLRAQVPQQKLVLNNPKIEMVWDTEVIEINYKLQKTSSKQVPISNNQITNEKLENILIKNNKTGEEKTLQIDGLFVAIGRIPSTNFLQGLVKLKEAGQVITKIDPEFLTMTSVPGIFAAGDCVEENHRQAIVAAGDGCRAGLEAEKWLKLAQ